MNTNDYKRAIQIGRNMQDIFRLPCVVGIHKMNDEPLYLLNRGYDRVARVGDWLCEDYEGMWHLVHDKQPCPAEGGEV